MAVATAGLLGFADALTQSLNQTLVSEYFGDNVRIFGLYNFLQCIGSITGLMFSIVLTNVSLMYFILILIIVQILSNATLNKIPN